VFSVQAVFVAEALWNEFLHWLSQQLFPSIAKHFFSLSIDQNNFAFLIGDHHRIRRCLEKASKLLLCRFLLPGLSKRIWQAFHLGFCSAAT
jgi:hypothetical protein